MKYLAIGGFLGLLLSSAHAATLVENVTGYTFESDGKLRSFDSLLIGDDGKVIGTDVKAKLPADATRVDGHGATLLPGLIDAHGHVMGLAQMLVTVDLADTTSLEDALKRIREFAAEHPDAPWILGRGWNQVTWKLGRFPTAAELDRAVANRPVWMERVDGHAGWVNSKAIALSGVAAATKDPHGGRIERDGKGNPSGVFVDAAMDLVTGHIPPMTPEQAAAALQGAMTVLNSVGLTGVHDAGIDRETWQLYTAFGEAGKLTVRIHAMIGGIKAFDQHLSNGAGRIDGLYDDRLDLRSVKLYADGALGSRGAALFKPYKDDPKNKGLLFLDATEMNAEVKRIAEAGYQVNVHAIGDAANAEVIDAFEQAPREGLRHRIEHAQVLRPEDIARAAKLGLIASIQPTHATSDKVMAEQRLDPKRLEGAYAWRTWMKDGARIALGSDFPVESPNPFYGLWAAVTRDGWRTDQALTREEALKGFTLDAAYAGFQEKVTGSLEPGKWADFILIDRDYFKIDAKDIHDTKVRETWVAGKRVWCAEGVCGE